MDFSISQSFSRLITIDISSNIQDLRMNVCECASKYKGIKSVYAQMLLPIKDKNRIVLKYDPLNLQIWYTIVPIAEHPERTRHYLYEVVCFVGIFSHLPPPHRPPDAQRWEHRLHDQPWYLPSVCCYAESGHLQPASNNEHPGWNICIIPRLLGVCRIPRTFSYILLGLEMSAF